MDNDTKKTIAAGNLNAIPLKRLDYDSTSEPFLTLYVSDDNYRLDLERCGVKERFGNETEGYRADGKGNQTQLIRVQGTQSLKIMAEAGVNFPGAEFFGGPGPEESHAKRVRGS